MPIEKPLLRCSGFLVFSTSIDGFKSHKFNRIIDKYTRLAEINEILSLLI